MGATTARSDIWKLHGRTVLFIVPIFNSQCGEVSLNKKQMFHYQFSYILWIVKYLKNKRIQRSKIMDAHKPYCILPVILLRFQRIWKLINQHTDHSSLFLREFLPNITRHPLRTRISFSEFYVYSLKLIFPVVMKRLDSNIIRILWNSYCVWNRVKKQDFDKKLTFI